MTMDDHGIAMDNFDSVSGVTCVTRASDPRVSFGSYVLKIELLFLLRHESAMEWLASVRKTGAWRHRGVRKTFKIYIIIATSREDDGRRRGKLEVTKREPPSLQHASSPNHKQRQPVSSHIWITLSYHTIHSRG